MENTDCYINGRDFRKCNKIVQTNNNGGCKSCVNRGENYGPATSYQNLKVIQNTVRVPSSLYAMNLASLNVYEKPENRYQVIPVSGSSYVVSPGVNWNQMSDRKEPHVQKVVTASGSAYGGNSLKRSLVRMRPGAMSPGGVGVDIKHNSYDRYLNRIKGKGPLRTQPGLGNQNPAFPIYGVKTGLVNGCIC